MTMKLRRLAFTAWAVATLAAVAATLVGWIYMAVTDTLMFLVLVGVLATLSGWLFVGIWLSGPPQRPLSGWHRTPSPRQRTHRERH